MLLLHIPKWGHPKPLASPFLTCTALCYPPGSSVRFSLPIPPPSSCELDSTHCLNVFWYPRSVV